MSQGWFVCEDGQQAGPYAWKQLWEEACSGATQPADQVWVQGKSGWKLVGSLDPPVEHGSTTLKVAYRHADHVSLAYSHEDSGVIEAGGTLTRDSDRTGYDLYQLGFQRAMHRLVITVDSAEIDVGELVVA